MRKINRRTFNRILGAAGASAAVGLPASAIVARTKAKVVVIGGGFGGATAAKYLNRFDPAIEVTLVEPVPLPAWARRADQHDRALLQNA